ncbi:hypothetical protein GUITHDRAFT_164630 [Guillardia theta CCMP2712]|uniref:Uncharacterized protein n=1 Tax=Guillardia theta (strain CCMP2712) TaxID=905079 RepID=L1IWB6_GUITC|nr:hypothetical protein GUITHDRAFT_164630 [Guillardia theta CCMP2712]EKX40558.1 hypothetical protein GUITHDRAFT_164630 [Guillardia theta CCMP2712]|eukprot:XP_005827538.1 hypothetical protein GUITHDRAFT_164630 [Guillardia theta CCMP2712]
MGPISATARAEGNMRRQIVKMNKRVNFNVLRKKKLQRKLLMYSRASNLRVRRATCHRARLRKVLINATLPRNLLPVPLQRKADGIIAPQNDWEDDSLDSDEAIVRDMYRKEGFDVLFNPLSSSTSNVKLSFRIQNSQAVTIKELSEHIEKGLMLYINKRCSFKINEITTAQSKEGRLFFGGVVTIGMEMLEQNKKSQKASIRLFGFNNKDPEKRHKAQYSGQLSSNEDLFPLFRCLFEQQGRKIEDLQLSPNPVFSSTDNAVMDPSYGFDVDRMAKVLERLKEENKVEKYSKQLMLVKNPRRTRLETMRFLLTYCRDCIVSLESLKLNRRTLDKRNRVARPNHSISL